MVANYSVESDGHVGIQYDPQGPPGVFRQLYYQHTKFCYLDTLDIRLLSVGDVAKILVSSYSVGSGEPVRHQYDPLVTPGEILAHAFEYQES